MQEEGEEWSAVSIDDSDGGVPISIPKPVTFVQPTGFNAYKTARQAPPAGSQSQAPTPQAPKPPNAAARRAMEAKEEKKARDKAEAKAVSSDGGTRKAGGKVQANGVGNGTRKGSVGIDELADRFKGRLGLLKEDEDGEGEGGVGV